MSTDDASSRLSSALEEILSTAPPTADWSVDDDDDDEHGESATAHVTHPSVESSEPVSDAAADGSGGASDDVATYRLPEIVPATVEHPLSDVERAATAPVSAVAPTLPASPHAPPPPAAAPAPASPAAAPAAPHPPATSWADHMTTPIPNGAQGTSLRAPGRRPRVRRVTRVLRHIDPWSTFKVGLLFSAVAYVVFLTAGVLLWRVADSTGTLDNVERWFTQFGWETFELKGGEIFHDAWIIGLFGVVFLTGGLVLLATLFNLVSDIVGGVRMTVLEEEVVERTVSSTRRYVVRRPPVGAESTAVPGWDVDDADDPDGDAPADRAAGGASAGQSPPSSDWSVDDD